MHNQSLVVKFVIWSMVFLMSVGFAALVIQPFVGTSLFGGGGSNDATQQQLDDARSDVRKDDCTETKPKPTGARADRCRDALRILAQAYQTLALTPADEEATELPKDSKRNLDRAGDAYKAAYLIDTTDADTAASYAAFLRDQGKYAESLPIWQSLVKANPKKEDYLEQQAAAQQGANQLDAAIATYQLYLKRFPDSGKKQTIKDNITAIQDQQKQSAAGGGAPGASISPGAGGNISLG